MKQFFFLAVSLSALLLFSCSEKKVDAEKLNHANALVNTAHFAEGIDQLEALAKESPSDVALKQSLVSAHLKYAAFFMYNDTLSPKEKYPSALKQYREVLKIDPTNADAKQNADLIINIYHQMGREVPNV
jgi:tetratricopeptide (TPR) repeat protein